MLLPIRNKHNNTRLLLLTNAIGILIAWILYNRKWMWVAGLLMTLSFITGMNRARQAFQNKKSHYINYYDLKKQ
ncbi:MAG: hypothetical protein P8M60_05415 [Flavobacteriaceae bacterium]|nr:hypothetical protein [Flavobacteriaceae bacterium]